MTRAQWWILLLGVGLINISLMAITQTQAGAGPWQGMARYDPKTETTIQATVEEVKQITGKRGWSGTHLMVRTETGTLEVHVGPAAYIASQQFAFAKGDKIEVTGSKTTLQGTEVLLAREIKKDAKSLVLRDAQGFPKWAGGRRGQP
jgi:DNA/RNA endonuclease YhcR with UshA esterase domain